MADYALRLKAQYGWNDTWVAGYSHDVFGYTPSARVLREGDYEAVNSGYIAPFSPAIEELIVSKVAELVARKQALRGRILSAQEDCASASKKVPITRL